MRGDGIVYQPAGSRFWHYVFWVDGTRVKGSTGEVEEERARRVLQKKREAMKRGDEVPHEDRVRLADLRDLLVRDYERKRNRSTATMCSTFKHLTAFFGANARATRLGDKLDDYIADRRAAGAAEGSIRIELALLNRAFRLAVKKKRIAPRSRPDIELPPEDKTAVRKGFFRRADVERLCPHLAPVIADVVLFLFFCPWRIGGARRLEWRDYSGQDRALTLRPELNKTGYQLQIPVDAENTPELMAVIARQKARRRPDCPYIFHGSGCGTPRFDKRGNRRPCLGDFQKIWDRACIAIGFHRPDPDHPGDPNKVKAARTPHDLRRSGVKHYIDAGVDPHTVMAWSGHRTPSMLRRYHILDLDDLRRAGKKASDYRGPKENVVKADFGGTVPEPSQTNGNSRVESEPLLS
jgi:integrase